MFSANENLLLRQHKRQIVQWIEATMPDAVLDLGVNTMVMQVSCKAPGCVPLETAIIIIFPPSPDQELIPGLSESKGSGSFKTKVLKPMAEVTQDDVFDALPPAFEGGRRSTQRLLFQARDIMLGQITQLFGDGDVEDRGLAARYLQEALQDYMDRNCEPPEEGDPFTPIDTEDNGSKVGKGPFANPTVATSATTAPAPSISGAGNRIFRRTNQDTTSRDTAVNTSAIPTTTASVSATRGSFAPPPRTDSVAKRRQQQTASKQLKQSGNPLAQLIQREHPPGIRRPGCPCCDSEHPSNVVDKLMMQL